MWERKWVPREERARGVSGCGKHRREFSSVGLDEESATFGYVLANAVTVLETVTKLAKRVDVAQKSRTRAQGHAGSQVLVVFGASATVELNHGERVQCLRVRANRRFGH